MKPLPLFALLITVTLAAFSHAAERPNLLFIIADDCTYLDMGVYGGQAKTPALDQLAGEGMQFSRCFQAAPMCSPTRHNIYTTPFLPHPIRSKGGFKALPPKANSCYEVVREIGSKKRAGWAASRSSRLCTKHDSAR